MNILIVENEVYLAQKIVSRLVEDGHHCDIFESTDKMDKFTKDYDIILLSTSLSSDFCQDLIKRYRTHSIILLLVSYVSEETVSNPIKCGAKDYIMKPFMMDELIRKIYHYKECQSVRKELKTLKRYINFIMFGINVENITRDISFPLLIESKCQKHSDKLVLEISKKIGIGVKFISLNSKYWQRDLNRCSHRNIIYLTDYHSLKKSVKDQVLIAIEDKKCIISSLEKEEDFQGKKIEIKNNEIVSPNSSIMTINDYVKRMVLSYQSKYPDTELSKKLGISRKSLWEKRKKLGIEKKRIKKDEV